MHRMCFYRPAALAIAASFLALLGARGQEAIFIEAEDFNFDGGQTIESPALGDYAGAGASLGSPDIDFRENTPSVRLGNEAADGYRAPAAGSPGLPQTVVSGDAPRADFTAAGLNEYDLSSIEAGEWTNYTRTFPAGNYRVRARVRLGDDPEPFIARLEKVTSDPTAAHQTSTAFGAFLGRNASMDYDFLPLTDVTGVPVTLALDGTETLRLSTQTGNYHLNYLEITPADAAEPMPQIEITAPANEVGVNPADDLSITLEVEDPAQVAAVQLLANSFDGEEITIGELAAPPFEFTWSGIPEGSYRLLGIVAATNGLVGLSSEITVFVDGTPPELLQARGRTINDVILEFSEGLAPQAASDAANYAIVDSTGAALEVTGVSVSSDGRVVVATADQSVGENYTLTLSNLTDRAGNPLAAGSTAEFFGNGPLLQDDLGFVVFEAEHFDRNLDGLWVEETDYSNPSGGASMLIPNGAGGSEAETKLEYDIRFVKTGTHYIWYRAAADDSGGDDSAWLHVDGERPPDRTDANRASMTGFNNTPEFSWRSNAQDGGGTMSFEITTPGFHTIGVARREDGARFDKFVITTDPNFDPGDPAFGDFGPPLTPREGQDPGEGGNSVEITLNPVDVAGDEHSTLVLQADGQGSEEGAVVVFQWQRQEGGEWVDIPGATDTTFTLPRVSLDWNDTVVRMGILTQGDAAFSTEATITVNPETEAPFITSVSGHGTRVSLLFSEPLDAASAQNPDNYEVADLDALLVVQSVTFLPSGRGVLLTTGEQAVGTKYTVTANNIADQAATPNVAEDATAKFYSLGDLLPQGDDGLLVFEAESYSENSDGLWEDNTEWGVPSGGISVVVPNGNGGNEDSKLEYELTFTQTGEHIIWYRAGGPSGTDDSGWFHLDGGRPDNRLDGNMASMTGFGDREDFVWRSQPQEGGGQMTFDIPAPGTYRIGLARREDGSYFDKFVITTDAGFDPSSFGPFGPLETRAGAPALPRFEISAPSEVPAGEDVVITPDIGPTDRDIAKVEYFVDGEKIGEATSSPYTFTWTRPAGGFYSVSAVWVDDTGAQVQGQVLDVFVEDGVNPDLPTVDGAGQSVVWISQVDSPAGDGFKELLAASQFDFTELFIEDPTEAEQEVLNAADVVVISRKTSSGNYNHETWDNAVTAPLILMTPYLSRSNRWAWLEADGLVDATPESIVAESPDHPIFQSVPLTDGVSGAWHVAVDRGTTLATDPVANGGTLLASGEGNLVVAEWPADTVAVGPRMLFAAGSREAADPGDIAEAGKFNLTPTGGQAFLNAVLYMTGLDAQPPVDLEVGIAVARTASGVMVNLSGADAFDLEYSATLDGDWTVIATDVTSFEDTDAGRTGAVSGYYRGVAR